MPICSYTGKRQYAAVLLSECLPTVMRITQQVMCYMQDRPAYVEHNLTNPKSNHNPN